MNEKEWDNLISGRTRGVGAALLRMLLAVATVPYGWIVRLRNVVYSAGILKSRRVDACVICVGNITTGGTGKTPLVISLCNALTQKGLRCAVLTRGYRTQADRLSDEPALLARGCSDTEIIVNPDRVAGATEAIRRTGAQVLIMDDGFQHRRLVRDLDIVTIDATRPFGYGKLLPAGLLREPPTALGRAAAAVITRSDQVEAATLAEIRQKLLRVNPKLVVAISSHTPVSVKHLDGRETRPDELAGTEVSCFCAIANPNAFLDTVRNLGVTIVTSRQFNDHHGYTDACLAQIRLEAQTAGAQLILTTEKDWIKVSRLDTPAGDIPLACLCVELRLGDGRDQLMALIDKASAGRIPPDSRLRDSAERP